MLETVMTVVGNVVDTPKLRRTNNGFLVANFRIASTPRRYDKKAGQWVDGPTLFVSVAAWRALAENIADSLHRGQPVIVTGRYYQREYEKNEMLHITYELEALAVGHDLSRGVSQFEKTSRRPAVVAEAAPETDPVDAEPAAPDRELEPAA